MHWFEEDEEEIRAATRVPRILFLPEVRQRLDLYVTGCKQEISGLGIVEPQNGDLIVTEAFILPQEVTASTTDLEPAAVAQWMAERVANGSPVDSVRLWWHSHANMSVFWSPTDEETIRTLSNHWMVSVVANHAGDCLARLDIYDPLRLTIDDVDVGWHLPVCDQLQHEIQQEIATKVTRKSLVTPAGFTPPKPLRVFEEETFGWDQPWGWP